MRDDEVLLPEDPRSGVRRVTSLPVILPVAIIALVGFGGHAAWKSGHLGDITSLHSDHWYAAWTSHPTRFDADGCTLDGDDCRSSRCCTKAGSRCYVKNHHWASCNETCQVNRKWQGRVNSRGYWTTTHHHVWDCADITVQPTEAATTAAPVVVVVTPAPAPSTSRLGYAIYEKDDDFKTFKYGDDSSRTLPQDAASKASVVWEEVQN